MKLNRVKTVTAWMMTVNMILAQAPASLAMAEDATTLPTEQTEGLIQDTEAQTTEAPVQNTEAPVQTEQPGDTQTDAEQIDTLPAADLIIDEPAEEAETAAADIAYPEETLVDEGTEDTSNFAAGLLIEEEGTEAQTSFASEETSGFVIYGGNGSQNVAIANTYNQQSAQSILGGAWTYGITANVWNFAGDAETNCAVKQLHNSTGDQTGVTDKGAGSLSSPFLVGQADGQIMEMKGAPAVITVPKEYREQFSRNLSSTTEFIDSTTEAINQQVESLRTGTQSSPMSSCDSVESYEDLPQGDSAQKLTLDLTQAEAGTYYLNVDRYPALKAAIAQNGALTIKKNSTQTIVFNYSSSDVNINKYMLCEDGVWKDSTGLANTSSRDFSASERIVFNAPNATSVRLDDTCGIILAPNATVDYWGVDGGWLVAGTVNAHCEWHFINGKLPEVHAPETETEAPTEKATEAPTEKATEAPTEKATEAPTEKATEAPTEKATEAPTEKATEAPTEAPTEPERPNRVRETETEQPATEQPTTEQPTNEQPTTEHELDVAKVDTAGVDLSGATLQLFKTANGAASGEAIDRWVTDGTRHAEKLAAGTYMLVEAAAPKGYSVSEPIGFTLQEDGSITLTSGQGVLTKVNGQDVLVMIDQEVKGVSIPETEKQTETTEKTTEKTTESVKAAKETDAAVMTKSRSETEADGGKTAAPVKTGDDTPIMALSLTLAISFMAMILLVVLRRKHRNQV